MPASSFIRASLLMFAGPLVWAVHFLIIYGLTGIVCARPALQRAWSGISIIAWGAGLATAAAVGAIAAIHLRIRRECKKAGGTGFMHRIAEALGLVSLIAIAWETVPVFFVPGCGW